jgi:penicillin amidase
MATLSARDSPWCDDVRTKAIESCDDTVSKALHDGMARLTKQLGNDMHAWRWDAVHHAVFAHAAFNGIPVLGKWLRREVPHGGDWSTRQRGSSVRAQPVRPALDSRLPADRGSLPADDSRFLDAVGQVRTSAVFALRRRAPLWAAVKHRKMRMDRPDVEAGAIGHLRLTPK